MTRAEFLSLKPGDKLKRAQNVAEPNGAEILAHPQESGRNSFSVRAKLDDDRQPSAILCPKDLEFWKLA